MFIPLRLSLSSSPFSSPLLLYSILIFVLFFYFCLDNAVIIGLKDIFAGSLGGVAQVLSGHPLDTVKVRKRRGGRSDGRKKRRD